MESLGSSALDFVRSENFSKLREVSRTKKTCNFLFELDNLKAIVSFKFGAMVNLYVKTNELVGYICHVLNTAGIVSDSTSAYLKTQELTVDEFFDVIGECDVFKNSKFDFTKGVFLDEFVSNLTLSVRSRCTSITNLTLKEEIESGSFTCLIESNLYKNFSVGQIILSRYELEQKRDNIYKKGNYVKFSKNIDLTLDKFIMRGIPSEQIGIPVNEIICDVPGLISSSIDSLVDLVNSARIEIESVQYVLSENRSISVDSGIEQNTSKNSGNLTVEYFQPNFNIFAFEILSFFALCIVSFSLFACGETFYAYLANLLLK